MFHITNGESVVMSLRDSGLAGDVLAWRDALHEGPVPAGLALEQLSVVRAGFLTQAGLSVPGEDVAASFRQRDASLKSTYSHDEIVLWFEHDLYDQLQLLQLLSWFSRECLTNPTECDTLVLGHLERGECDGRTR